LPLRLARAFFFHSSINLLLVVVSISGVNVVLYAYNADLRGVYENVEIGQYLAKTFDFNLNAITESLRTFVPIPPETLSAATVEDRYHSHRHT